ncbi:MAG: PRD domain-containing protein [Solobacterium sp.]|nr:PRD domain-containing protein [Solobacterium sp.]
MKVVKKINNNVAICVDGDGNELIGFGKGIGFPKTPYELTDLSKLERTFYGVSPENFNLLEQIDKDYFDAAAVIVEFAERKIDNQLNPNLVFTLADHLSFAVERTKKGLTVKMPNAGILEAQYPVEMGVARQAREYLNKRFQVRLGRDEIASVALHLINAQMSINPSQDNIDREEVCEEITKLIESSLSITMERSSFNYTRFLTHLEYMLDRSETKTMISTDNRMMFNSLKEQFPEVFLCSEQIENYIEQRLNWRPNDEEKLYLMIHINRLRSRES